MQKEQFESLVESLQINQCENLKISEALSTEQWSRLLAALEHTSSLKTLEITMTINKSIADYKQLIRCLPNNKNLSKIDLSYAFYPELYYEEEANAIASHLSSMLEQLPNLLSFKINPSKFGPRGAKHIANIIPTHPRLEEVDLGTSIRFTGRSYLAEGFFNRYQIKKAEEKNSEHLTAQKILHFYQRYQKRKKLCTGTAYQLFKTVCEKAKEEQLQKINCSNLVSIEQNPEYLKLIFASAQMLLSKRANNECLLMMGRSPYWLVEACQIMGANAKELIHFNFSGKPYIEELPLRSQLNGMRQYLTTIGLTPDSLRDPNFQYCIVDVIVSGKSLEGLLFFLTHWLYEDNHRVIISSSEWSKICLATEEFDQVMKKISRIIPLTSANFHQQYSWWAIGSLNIDTPIKWPHIFGGNKDHTLGVYYGVKLWDKPQILRITELYPDSKAIQTKEALASFVTETRQNSIGS